MSARLAALGWPGGKSAITPQGTGRWVNSLLPQRPMVYAEPFAGMLGVLLQRRRARTEIVSDIDYRLMNLWMVWRDDPEGLTSLIERTPDSSAAHLEEANRRLAEWEASPPGEVPEMGDLRAAYSLAVLLCCSTHGRLNIELSNPRAGRHRIPDKERWMAVAERVRKVRMMLAPALEVINLVSPVEDSLIYADPPYQSAQNFYVGGVDYEELEAALLGCAGKVALSGQVGDEYPALEAAGWHRSERGVWRSIGFMMGRAEAIRATEVLWTNYDPAEIAPQSAFDFGDA